MHVYWIEGQRERGQIVAAVKSGKQSRDVDEEDHIQLMRVSLQRVRLAACTFAKLQRNRENQLEQLSGERGGEITLALRSHSLAGKVTLMQVAKAGRQAGRQAAVQLCLI